MKKTFMLILILALGVGAATTYYINWTAGDDTKTGTSKANAWKRHPYMTGYEYPTSTPIHYEVKIWSH